MARKDDALGVSGFETVIGAGVTVHGHLTSEGDMLIDGALEGDINSTGDITVGVNGRIKADIAGLNVTIAGELDGNIVAEGQAIIRETGRVHGDITAEGLTIASGGMFRGRSLTQKHSRLDHTPAQDKEA